MRAETQHLDQMRREPGLLADPPGLGDQRRDSGGGWRRRARRGARPRRRSCHKPRGHEQQNRKAKAVLHRPLGCRRASRSLRKWMLIISTSTEKAIAK